MNIVRELRKKAGVQQKELALTIGVSQPTISEWESCKKDPSGERLQKLAQFFKVDELMILGRGVVDLSQEPPDEPTAPEIRIVSGVMKRMTQEQREQVVGVIKAMFVNHPELFDEKKG